MHHASIYWHDTRLLQQVGFRIYTQGTDEMNRRNFLQCLGAFAASTFLPSCSENIIRAPSWAKQVTVFRTAKPLKAGNYTFTSYAGDLGVYIAGVKAMGGETLFEVPSMKDNRPFDNPRLKLGGITVSFTETPPPIDFTDARTRDNMIRGDSVEEMYIAPPVGIGKS